jgi:Protein of unknown function (DUF3617)
MNKDGKAGAAALAMLAAVAWLAAPAAAQEVTPGEWHYSTAIDMPAGSMPSVPPEALAKLPPEMRAKVEAMMHGHRVEYSVCVTSRRAMPQMPKNYHCKLDRMRRDGDKIVWSAACRMPNGMVSHADAVATYHRRRMEMDMKIDATGPDGNPMTTRLHTTGRYVGPCQAG